MALSENSDLTQFNNLLADLYGDNLRRLVLFGSRARGDNMPDSDYDLAVFVNIRPDRRQEIDRLAALRLPFFDNKNLFFDVTPYRAEDHHKDNALMFVIRSEGVTLYESDSSRSV